MLPLAVLTLLQAQKPTATVKLDSATASVGKPVRGTLTLVLPAGLHGYQNPPSGQFDIPVKLSAEPGFRLSKIDYPKGEPMRVAGDDKPTRVYQGTVRIPFTLVAAKPGTGVGFHVDYQLCTMQMCYPPASIVVRMPLKVTR